MSGYNVTEGQILQNLQAEAIVVSDIHLLSLTDEKGRALLDFLETVAESEVHQLILLGDIFDFCLGSHPYYQEKFALLGESLRRCVASGTRVLYVEGNHEFRVKDLGWDGVEFFSGETEYVILPSGMTLQLGHGDMIFSHRRYKAFRRVVKSRWFTGLASMLPGRFMDWLATKAAETSRAQDAYRTIHHDRILQAAYAWLESGKGDCGLFGHFHVPYAEARRDDKPGGVFSMKCWDEPNFLVIQQGQFFRLVQSADDGTWQWQPAQSYFAEPTQASRRPAFVPPVESGRTQVQPMAGPWNYSEGSSFS
jgi:UDP-2,3-diacylglucosamine hydrolase